MKLASVGDQLLADGYEASAGGNTSAGPPVRTYRTL